MTAGCWHSCPNKPFLDAHSMEIRETESGNNFSRLAFPGSGRACGCNFSCPIHSPPTLFSTACPLATGKHLLLFPPIREHTPGPGCPSCPPTFIFMVPPLCPSQRPSSRRSLWFGRASSTVQASGKKTESFCQV